MLARPGRLRAQSGSKLPTATFRFGPRKEEFFDGRCLRYLQVLYRFGCRKGLFSIHKRYSKQQQESQKKAKTSQGIFKDTPEEQG